MVKCTFSLFYLIQYGYRYNTSSLILVWLYDGKDVQNPVVTYVCICTAHLGRHAPINHDMAMGDECAVDAPSHELGACRNVSGPAASMPQGPSEGPSASAPEAEGSSEGP